jgi:hypothetical protein
MVRWGRRKRGAFYWPFRFSWRFIDSESSRRIVSGLRGMCALSGSRRCAHSVAVHTPRICVAYEVMCILHWCMGIIVMYWLYIYDIVIHPNCTLFWVPCCHVCNMCIQ